jgi:hypothetical protein
MTGIHNADISSLVPLYEAMQEADAAYMRLRPGTIEGYAVRAERNLAVSDFTRAAGLLVKDAMQESEAIQEGAAQ